MKARKIRVIIAGFVVAMVASTFTTMSTTVLANELLCEEEFVESEVIDEFCDQDSNFPEAEDVISDGILIDDCESVIMKNNALMAADPAAAAGIQNTYTPPEKYIPSGNAMFYKRDGENYMYSPDLGGEMTVRTYAEIIKEIYDTFGVEVAIEFAESIDENPHDKEILRVFGPWEILDHWERRIDEKTNRWEL